MMGIWNSSRSLKIEELFTDIHACSHTQADVTGYGFGENAGEIFKWK